MLRPSAFASTVPNKVSSPELAFQHVQSSLALHLQQSLLEDHQSILKEDLEAHLSAVNVVLGQTMAQAQGLWDLLDSVVRVTCAQWALAPDHNPPGERAFEINLLAASAGRTAPRAPATDNRNTGPTLTVPTTTLLPADPRPDRPTEY